MYDGEDVERGLPIKKNQKLIIRVTLSTKMHTKFAQINVDIRMVIYVNTFQSNSIRSAQNTHQNMVNDQSVDVQSFVFGI